MLVACWERGLEVSDDDLLSFWALGAEKTAGPPSRSQKLPRPGSDVTSLAKF